MITLVEPQQHIAKLWSKPTVREGETYRLMRYVLRVDCDGKTLLQNAITYEVVVLCEEEKNILLALPQQYTPCMKQLIENHFIVQDHYDEHQLVQNLRHILRTLENPDPSITKYTILPTTACNARCYYCFEHGVKNCTMTKQTADDVVAFIASHCGNQKSIRITWFGGEPTVASQRIDQITTELKEKGISFYSDMTTNGYLFDSEMVRKAKELWNLLYLQICFDGLEMHHNYTKNYVNPGENPFVRTLDNIGLLLDKGIRVGLRMNFDLLNHDDFYGLLKEVSDRFKGHSGLSVYAFPVIGTYTDYTGEIHHGTTDWFMDEIAKLNEQSREQGMYFERQVLPFLKYHCCDAENDSAITITPEGKLVRCCQCLDDDECVGTIWQGITDENLFLSWKQYADYESCRNCVYFPKCLRVEKCPGKNRCQFMKDWDLRNQRSLIHFYHHWVETHASFQEGVV